MYTAILNDHALLQRHPLTTQKWGATALCRSRVWLHVLHRAVGSLNAGNPSCGLIPAFSNSDR